MAYYFIGCFVFIWYLWSGPGILKPPRWPKRIARDQLFDILNVGATSSIVSLSTNISIATATGLAGIVGAAALAGYGTGARLEYLLIPLVFGLGAPLVALVGTNIGAGQQARALRIALTGGAIAFALTEAIGLVVAIWPYAWLGLFGSDPHMLETGAAYLRIVGPAYGFFGLGLSLYFASQGAGRLMWPLVGSALRLAIGIGGGWIVLRLTGSLDALFAALTIALVVYGIVVAGAIAAGVWFGAPPSRGGKQHG